MIAQSLYRMAYVSTASKQFSARICQLPEHHGIILLIKEYMDQRQFTDWYMAFEMSPGLNIPGYSEFLNTSLTNDLLSFPLSRCTKLLHLLKVNIH
jgi:hypothetical protein